MDCVAKIKLSTGEVARVGDMGHSHVKPWPAANLNDAQLEDFDPNYFYMLEAIGGGGSAGTLGEITTIQVEPENSDVETMKAGEAFAYEITDLFD